MQRLDGVSTVVTQEMTNRSGLSIGTSGQEDL